MEQVFISPNGHTLIVVDIRQEFKRSHGRTVYWCTASQFIEMLSVMGWVNLGEL